MDCVDFNDVQNNHFVASSIKDLFDNVEAQNIIDFIKETRFISNLNVFILMLVIYFYSNIKISIQHCKVNEEAVRDSTNDSSNQ